MILAQKKAKVFRAQQQTECAQVEQSATDEGSQPGMARRSEGAEQSGLMNGRRPATKEQGSPDTFEVDLLDCWCKP